MKRTRFEMFIKSWPIQFFFISFKPIFLREYKPCNLFNTLEKNHQAGDTRVNNDRRMPHKRRKNYCTRKPEICKKTSHRLAQFNHCTTKQGYRSNHQVQDKTFKERKRPTSTEYFCTSNEHRSRSTAKRFSSPSTVSMLSADWLSVDAPDKSTK